MVLTVCDADGPAPAATSVDEVLESYLRRHRGRWQQMVNRSAITLKLLTHAPSGEPVTAPTMGLPEQEGGERNWDCRYTWIRDASLSVRAMREIGFTEEADAFRAWLGRRVMPARRPAANPCRSCTAWTATPTWRRRSSAISGGLAGIGARDGPRGSEGTFSLCGFLYVHALARAGRLRQARSAFDKMLTYANHVGLFAEEIGPTGEQLGNFPQAFTHLAVITAALALDEELDRAPAGGGWE